MLKQDVKFRLVVAVMIDLLVVKGNSFYNLMRAVELAGLLAKPAAGVNGSRKIFKYYPG